MQPISDAYTVPGGSQGRPVRAALAADQQPALAPLKPFGEDGLTFRDIFDLVNPLHHVPLLGNLYRRITGDVIDPAIRVAGGALFGGPLGAGFAAASVAVKRAFEWRESGPRNGLQSVRRPEAFGDGSLVPRSEVMGPPAKRPDAVPNEDASPGKVRERRGGWIVQAAYAMADARLRHEAIIRASRGIDTTV